MGVDSKRLESEPGAFCQGLPLPSSLGFGFLGQLYFLQLSGFYCIQMAQKLLAASPRFPRVKGVLYCLRVPTSFCIYIYTHAHIHKGVYVFMYVCMYGCMYVCM